ncbi:MAG: lipoyl(octanoyl) transferase LipB [Burkholderiales bacterium]|uniref:lipoyl(octanoyl) transferase LipB n=1 Tax=Nitrosomonas sp. TaxID=42353 RepID=UPI001D543BAE|nr:lipoyl(octanoyl) transferase LipB [Nitrosomonas sp.]MCB1950291.1 lipoyl(octanoyl) transferase LipB [Nitrosomonas sp.]MCP5243044.1 lipoyl(octanoyl) transferase LipB [Burkholderiales bacterium]
MAVNPLTAQNAGSESNFGFIVKQMGLVEYGITWQAMKDFTRTRTSLTTDEIWLLQHPAVYTQGVAGKPEHLLIDSGITVIKTDRGGQITYHGPGQLIVYLLLDIRRLKLGVRELVRKMEAAVIHLLSEYQISAHGREDMPGVYVGAAKIASLGLKIKKNYCYHGIALNVDMDLKPFSAINPCGYAGLKVTQTKDLGINDELDVLSAKLSDYLQQELVK